MGKLWYFLGKTKDLKKGGHGEMEQVKKPACICNYNENMSGVDHIDQMISYYLCTRKTLKSRNPGLLMERDDNFHQTVKV